MLVANGRPTSLCDVINLKSSPICRRIVVKKDLNNDFEAPADLPSELSEAFRDFIADLGREHVRHTVEDRDQQF